MSGAAVAELPATPALPWRQQIAHAMAGEKAAWLFILKTLLAIYLTGWLAMRLQLGSPSVAMVTVIVVMNRQSGRVLAKSLYRGLGTLLGCTGAILAVALFPQQPLPLVLFISLWAGLCAGGAVLFRHFRAYAFVLAGYTAAMIVLPAMNHPVNVFDSAFARTSEVLLGLLVASVVFDAVFPVRLRGDLRGSADRNFDGFLDFIRDSSRGALVDHAAMEHTQMRVVRGALGFEDLRTAAFFDDPSLRTRNGVLKLLNQRFMASASRFQSLHHLIDRLRRKDSTAAAQALMRLLRPLGDVLDERATRDDLDRLADALATCRRQIAAQATHERAALEPACHDDFDAGLALLRHFLDELRDYVRTKAHLDLGRRAGAPLPRVRGRVHFARTNDSHAVLLAMLRSAAVTLVLSLLWLSSGWTGGGVALFGLVALISMASAAPDPVFVSRRIAIGHLLAPIVALPTYSVLPLLPTYPLLVLGTLPLLMLSLYLVTRPRLAIVGTAMSVGILVALTIGEAPHVDAPMYLNSGLSFAVGACLAIAIFQLIPSGHGSKGRRRRLLRRLRGLVRLAAGAPLPGLLPRFESLARDLFGQIVAQTRPGSRHSRELLGWALMVHETAHALIGLRHSLTEQSLPPVLHADLDAALDALARVYERLDPAEHAAALACLRHVLAQIDLTRPALREHLHLLLGALQDDDSVLVAGIDRQQRLRRSPETAHAV